VLKPVVFTRENLIPMRIRLSMRRKLQGFLPIKSWYINCQPDEYPDLVGAAGLVKFALTISTYLSFVASELFECKFRFCLLLDAVRLLSAQIVFLRGN